MKKYIATFIFGAATGGISSAFALRSDIYQDNQVKYKYDEEKFRQLNEIKLLSPLKTLPQRHSHKEYKDGSRFLERTWRTPGWENFDIRPEQKWDFNWDHRHFDERQEVVCSVNDSNERDENRNVKSRPIASRHLILIRHGQYNLDGKTDAERRLTELGIQQACLAGERLASLRLPFTHMVSSTMTRAKETADLIQPFLPPNIPILPNDSILCEGAPFPPEPRVSSWKPEMQYHVDGSRIEAAFRKYFHRADPEQIEDSFEVVVCHANVIRYFVCRALQLPPEAWLRISLKHASVTWVTIRPDGRASIRALGEAGYMPPDKLTTTRTVTPY